MSKFTRREFLKTGGLALAGLTIAPSSILGKSHGHVPPSDRLKHCCRRYRRYGTHQHQPCEGYGKYRGAL